MAAENQGLFRIIRNANCRSLAQSILVVTSGGSPHPLYTTNLAGKFTRRSALFPDPANQADRSATQTKAAVIV
jgi:hypothetical protein